MRLFSLNMKTLVIIGIVLILGQAQSLLDTAPLHFEFDEQNGRQAVITWNKLSFDPTRISEIRYRKIGYQQPTGPLGVRTSVIPQNGPWKSLAQGPQQRSFSYYFIKPHFCDNFEFCLILSAQTLFQRQQPQIISAANGAFDQCQGISQILGVPPMRLSNTSIIRVNKMYYSRQEDRIRVMIDRMPTFDYWTKANANIRNIRANVTAANCQKLVAGTALEPAVDPSGLVVTFDPDYAKDECTFYYQITAELNLPGETCSVVYTVPLNRSLIIRLSCDNILDFTNCGVPSSISVRTSDSCFTCSPNIVTEAVLEHDQNSRANQRKVKVSWSFPETGRPERLPKEYKIRVAKADLIGSFHSGSLEREVSFDTSPYYRKFVILGPYDGRQFGFTTPSFTVQICAIYDARCESSIPWSQESKHPVRLRDFEDEWTKMEENARLGYALRNPQYIYNNANKIYDGAHSYSLALKLFLLLFACTLCNIH